MTSQTPNHPPGAPDAGRGTDSGSLLGEWSWEALEGGVSNREGKEPALGMLTRRLLRRAAGVPVCWGLRDRPELPCCCQAPVGASGRGANSQHACPEGPSLHICVREEALGMVSFGGAGGTGT